jgi:hypothetical protein
LKFALEYVAAPVPGTVMVVAPLTTCIESAAAMEAVEAASKRHKNNFFILILIFILRAALKRIPHCEATP